MELLILSNPEKEYPSNVIPPRFQKTIDALEEGGIHASHRVVGTSREIKTQIDEIKPSIVFSSAYYTLEDTFGRKNIHGLLDFLRVPYIGSDEKSLELVISKQALKKRWIKAGIRTPSSTVIRLNRDVHFWGFEQLSRLTRFPYILKPNREGNSRGIEPFCVVRERSALETTAKKLLEKYGEVIVERYLGDFADIHEYTVAMIGGNDHMLIMPSEIILREHHIPRLITTKDKDEHKTQVLPIQDLNEKSKIIQFARKAFIAAGVRDYSRCDIIFADKTLFAIEINGLPMIPDRWFQECAAEEGLNETQYINAIVLAGIVRNTRPGISKLSIPTRMKEILPPNIFQQICWKNKHES
jgi:D-alanine-D-alanine ligase